MSKVKILSGTGHRPPTLGIGYSSKEAEPYMQLIEEKVQIINPDIGITGMASGFDLWYAKVLIKLGIPFWAYTTEQQTANWPEKAAQEYFEILAMANTEVQFPRAQYHLRDRGMVDDSTYVLALLKPDVKKGGTYYTVNYADSKGKTIYHLL